MPMADNVFWWLPSSGYYRLSGIWILSLETLIYTKVFDELSKAWESGFRRFFIEGGTASSKTWSIVQFLKHLLENYPRPILATITSESMPHLKRGAIRDFLKIIGEELIQSHWNKTDFIYTFPKSGSKLEFVSADQPAKLRGGRRDILFCNEANNIARDSFREADMRTLLFTIADWNPVSEFWFHDEDWADDSENVYMAGVTYRDTPEVVSDTTIKDIEKYAERDPNWYRVYGLGLLGKLEGLVYPNFKQIEELPEGNYFYGLDWGYSIDPTVLVKNIIIGENLYSQEIFYDDSGLTNDQISRRIDLAKVTRSEPIFPDPNEPKSGEELRKFGWHILDTVKGAGSVDFGRQKVNQYYQYWTTGSLNCIREQRNFRYLEDKQHPGIFTDKTTHQFSHGMSARRYAVASYRLDAGNSLPSSQSYRRPASLHRVLAYPSSLRR